MGWPDPSFTRWASHSGRPVIEDGLRLTIHDVVKAAKAKPMTQRRGTRWWALDGEKPDSWIDWTLCMYDDYTAHLILDYRINGKLKQQTFDLVSSPCRFGGRRWFAICPHTKARVSMLYSVGGARGFMSRKANDAAYRCQNESRYFDRAIRTRNKILRRLGTMNVTYQPKPKRMRWRTYYQLQRDLDRAERACTAGIAMFLERAGTGDREIIKRALAEAPRAAPRKRKKT